MAFGPAAGLALVDALADEPALARYHLLPSVRGDLLAKLGRTDEARAEFERAAALTRNARERDAAARAKRCAPLRGRLHFPPLPIAGNPSSGGNPTGKKGTVATRALGLVQRFLAGG